MILSSRMPAIDTISYGVQGRGAIGRDQPTRIQ